MIAGAYPVRQTVGGVESVVGAVIVIKERRTFPGTIAGIMSLAARYALAVSVFIAVLIGIPAILMALVIGNNRARSIARPVNDLARAAERLAAGDLSVRVWVPTDDEVARLARAFNRMGDRLQLSLEQEADARARAEQLLATNRDLVANVSHELRTPVALIRGHIEALADEPARLDDYTAIALRESDRLDDLVNDLFQLARIDAQGLQMEMVPFDTGVAAREATESLAGPVRRDTGIIMTSVVQGDSQRLVVVGDRARLVQVMQNLLRNAVRYTPEGGLIRVVVTPEGDSVVIRVQDTGVGSRGKTLSGCSTGSSAATSATAARAVEPGSGSPSRVSRSRAWVGGLTSTAWWGRERSSRSPCPAPPISRPSRCPPWRPSGSWRLTSHAIPARRRPRALFHAIPPFDDQPAPGDW